MFDNFNVARSSFALQLARQPIERTARHARCVDRERSLHSQETLSHTFTFSFLILFSGNASVHMTRMNEVSGNFRYDQSRVIINVEIVVREKIGGMLRSLSNGLMVRERLALESRSPRVMRNSMCMVSERV